MRNDDNAMRILLVSDNPDRAERISQMMRQHQLSGELHRVRPGKKAVARIRRSGRFRHALQHDLVLLDFAEPGDASLATVLAVAFRSDRPQPPVILLMSADSETVLQSTPLASKTSDLFEPMGLFNFFDKMRKHARSRFLRALNVIAEFGPVLVRVPAFVADSTTERGAGLCDQKLVKRVA